MIDNKKLIIIIVLIILFIIIFNQYYIYTEGFRNVEQLTSVSNEAVQGLASVYNSGQIRVTNLQTTGNATIGGNATITGNTTLNGTTEVNASTNLKGITDVNNVLRIFGYNGRPTMRVNLSAGGETPLFDGLEVKDRGIISNSVTTDILTAETIISRSLPGAYLVGREGGSFPIFSSISEYDKLRMNDVDLAYYVLPGYKLEVFRDMNYVGEMFNFDNTTGRNVIFNAYHIPSRNIYGGSSCKLYYKGTHIPQLL